MEIQERLNGFPVPPAVIMLTGYGDVPMTVRAMRAGAHEFLQKPYRSQDLVAAVRRCVEINRVNRDRYFAKATHRKLIEILTTREKQVFEHVIRGLSNKEIARALSTSPRTVEVQRMNMMRKLGASSIAALIDVAIQAGVKVAD